MSKPGKINSTIVTLMMKIMERKMMNYTDQISAIYLNCSKNVNKDQIKKYVVNTVGDEFVVKTNYEKNELNIF